MKTLDKVLYTARTHTTGGRDGQSKSDDGRLSVEQSHFAGSGKGTNPDELLAAAHAGCFVMALSLILGKEGYTPDSLEATSEVTMDLEKLELTGSHLTLNARIPNIAKDTFMELAKAAKENCPVSKALSIKITMDANLLS